MQHTLRMRGSQSRAKLPRDFNGFILGQSADAAEKGREIFAIDVLHRVKSLAVDFTYVVYTTHIRMRNSARHPHFVTKSLEQSFVAGRFIGKKFHRYLLSERQVVGAIDLAHAAFAQQRDDAIASGDQASGKKASFIDQVVGGTRRPG